MIAEFHQRVAVEIEANVDGWNVIQITVDGAVDTSDMLEAGAGFLQERLHILHGLVGLCSRVFRVGLFIAVETRLSTHVNWLPARMTWHKSLSSVCSG